MGMRTAGHKLVWSIEGKLTGSVVDFGTGNETENSPITLNSEKRRERNLDRPQSK